MMIRILRMREQFGRCVPFVQASTFSPAYPRKPGRRSRADRSDRCRSRLCGLRRLLKQWLELCVGKHLRHLLVLLLEGERDRELSVDRLLRCGLDIHRRLTGDRLHLFGQDVCLVAALHVASVAVPPVAVIAVLSRIPHAVPAPRKRTIRTAQRVRGRRIHPAIITLFSWIHLSVPAASGDKSAVHTVIRKTVIESPNLALLSEHRFHFSVPADADLEQAGIRTTVAGMAVGVIALLRRFEDAVAADRCGSDEMLLSRYPDQRSLRRGRSNDEQSHCLR